MSNHGAPCWYELSTADASAAQRFYGPILDWQFQDAGMPDFTYLLAMAGPEMVAGLMQPDTPMPDVWLTYFAVDDVDAAAARVSALGGAVHRPPEDIPGTGRFSIVADPQGAVFGLLQPTPGQVGTAFDQKKSGHGNWHELHTSDPKAALTFYADLLGWGATSAMDMGPMGTYQVFAQNGQDIGGMMGLTAPGVPPHWLPYFGVPSVAAAGAAITAAGGQVLHGPVPVPGGAQDRKSVV